MSHSFQRGAFYALAAVMLLCLVAGSAPAQKKRMRDAQRHANDAARVFNEIMASRDNKIPKNLLDRAEAIAIFPGVVKAAFIIGGRGGQGIISRRTRGGWSEPVFFNLGGGSF